jgi:lipopolysaccharide/colanic/teichoic acid biosynthesis glycosyltransferase
LIVLALLVKVDSKGPVFYIQKRVGRYGKEFGLFKYRTMAVGADKKGLLTVGERDNRVTKAGFFLRKFKLDELPQLFNVLLGNMSLVGPRPEVLKYVELYTDEQKQILNIRPGITDFASIYFSNENELLSKSANPELFYIERVMSQKIRLNKLYIRSMSLKLDFMIIFMTIGKIFKK